MSRCPSKERLHYKIFNILKVYFLLHYTPTTFFNIQWESLKYVLETYGRKLNRFCAWQKKICTIYKWWSVDIITHVNTLLKLRNKFWGRNWSALLLLIYTTFWNVTYKFLSSFLLLPRKHGVFRKIAICITLQ